MQVEHKTEKGTVLFVKVPDGAYNFSNNMQPNQLDYYTDTPFNGSKLTFSECIILTKVDWQLIGLTSEVTEKQAKMMLTFKSIAYIYLTWLQYYRDFTLTGRGQKYVFRNALDSFKSLIEFKNIHLPSVVLFKEN